MTIIKTLQSRVIRLTLAAFAFQAIFAAIFVDATRDHDIAWPNAPLRPKFRLQSSEGSIVDSHWLRGRPYLLFFGFANCPAICPITLAETQALLREAGAPTRMFSIYFVSVDPARDTPQALRNFVSGFGDNVFGLTGSDEEIATAAKSVRAYFSKGKHASVESVDHSALVYLVSSGGEVVSTVTVDEPKANALYKIRTLSVLGRL
ncbi:MAG: SCO family protein [Methylocystis sp.]